MGKDGADRGLVVQARTGVVVSDSEDVLCDSACFYFSRLDGVLINSMRSSLLFSIFNFRPCHCLQRPLF